MHHSYEIVSIAALLVSGCSDPCEDWGVKTFIHDSGRSSAGAVLGIEDGVVMGASPMAAGMARLDTEGYTRWKVEQIAPGLGDVKDVIGASDGGFVVAATQGNQMHESGLQLWVGGVSDDGEPTWETVLGPAHFYAWMKVDLFVHPEGGYVVSWHDSGAEGANTRMRLARIDERGTPLWSVDYPLSADSPVPEGWARGGAGMTAEGDIVQVTAEGDDLRLVRTAATGDPLSDVVMDVRAAPMDLVVMPDGRVLVLANDEVEAMVLEVEDDGWVADRWSYGLGAGRHLDELQWDPVHEVLYLGGTGPAEGRERPWTLIVDDEGSEIASVIDEELTVGLVVDASPLPAGGFVVARHAGASLHLETVLPCDDL
jgi:hypothetical protein